MNITVIGAGYVGLVTSACFAELGNDVVCIDIDKDKIKQLRTHHIPFYEPGLQNLVESNAARGRLHFVNRFEDLPNHPKVIFIAVGTPQKKDDSADISAVLAAANAIGKYIYKYCVVVDKSTVPVGITQQLKKIIRRVLNQRHVKSTFDVVSNPEFLREGVAINDFMHPERIIVGVTALKAKALMAKLYLPLIRNPEKIYFMHIKDAEMTKYAANAMLATRISFMNEIAILCERLGVDVENVRLGIGSDSRIGNLFIYPGCGYGGSCFPKDIKALIHLAEQHQVEPMILKAVEGRNQLQKQLLAKKIIELFGEDLSKINIGIWGLSFKPGTDDMREASSLTLLEQLLKRQAKIRAFDPVANSMAERFISPGWVDNGQLKFVEQQYDAIEGADALILVTEWQSFSCPDLAVMKKLMRRRLILDGRNHFDPEQLRAAKFEYYGIGRGR